MKNANLADAGWTNIARGAGWGQGTGGVFRVRRVGAMVNIQAVALTAPALVSGTATTVGTGMPANTRPVGANLSQAHQVVGGGGGNTMTITVNSNGNITLMPMTAGSAGVSHSFNIAYFV